MMGLTSDEYKGTIHQLWKERDALRAEVERLKKELSFYKEMPFEDAVRENPAMIYNALNELVKSQAKEIEQLKAQRDRDIAAAVEAAKAKMWGKQSAPSEVIERFGEYAYIGYYAAIADTFGDYRPTPEDSSALKHNPPQGDAGAEV